ncbi:hypothetical protein OIU34_20615 [Pararhizobium sp. BT-229]|uniref:hypothetical protein n=1 Tax=Pararhizobium sp. BT-229 TaxID=2986923 RepID=UPI0021F78952|nr:hypothetical protein [Pararhizobium sp. BT-229]MCV9964293.1 hypothetical protein [Pararhizobium sp. BT-229]
MLAHLIENYFVGISLAETQDLLASGKTEFEGDQHYCEHLLVFAKSMIGPGYGKISAALESEFAEGKALADRKAEAMLVRAGFVGLFRNGRPWNDDAVKNTVLTGQTEDRYLTAAAWIAVNTFSRIMQTNEGSMKTLDAEGIFFEVQSGVRRAASREDAVFEEITTRIGRYFAEFINGNLPVDDAVRHISEIGSDAARPLRSVFNAIMIGFINDDATEAASMAHNLSPNDFVTAALASAFSATSRLRRPGMKQLLRARSIFSGTDGDNKQYDEREEHLKLVVDGIERRRKHYDDIRGWIIREQWWALSD